MAFVLGLAAPAQAEPLQPIPWKAGDLKKGRDVSGIACVKVADGERRCLVAVDEEFSANLVTLSARQVQPDGLIRLAPETDEEELDAEAAAYGEDGSLFWVVGSHGVKRRSCEPNPSSHALLWFPVDPTTGRPAFDHRAQLDDPSWVAPEIGSIDLTPAIETVKELRDFLGKCLPTQRPRRQFENQNGVNIEGLAVFGGDIFVGFRGPIADSGEAYLLKFARDDILSGRDLEPQLLRARLGPGMGVRDLAAVKDGVIILSGPEDDVRGEASLHHFDPETGEIMKLDPPLPEMAEGQPEALLILEEADRGYVILILSDGGKEGLPTEFHVHRK